MQMIDQEWSERRFQKTQISILYKQIFIFMFTITNFI